MSFTLRRREYVHATMSGRLLLSAIAVFLFRPTESVSAGVPEERAFAKGSAVRVVIKGPSESYILTDPSSTRIGDRGFLSGWKLRESTLVHIPVSEIVLIEEYPTVAALKKAYRLDEPDPSVSKTKEVDKK
jgi:hypothetical protein